MKEHTIKPEKITKPIQILGAWLAGLFSIDSCFLFAAANLGSDTWGAKALIIAAILNVPIFLLAVFLLQTKFRPELQEDSYYSTYLSNKTNQKISLKKREDAEKQNLEKHEFIERSTVEEITKETIDISLISPLRIGLNKHLEERQDIKNKMRQIGIFKCTSFGGENPPIGKNVSISEYLNDETTKEVVSLARILGFQSYNFFDNREESTEEDVLLGSYGSAEFEII